MTQEDILNKLGIEKLNPMQEEALESIQSDPSVVLLSPTGTGKTVAYLLPVFSALDANCSEIQVLVLVPTRELAIQIEQVARKMATGHKINAVYGGRADYHDKIDLKHRPAILIGTPGRVADHLRKESFDCELIHTLVLDEFDKSLEIGYEVDMREIVAALPNIQKRILTSATQDAKVPVFVGLKDPTFIDYLHEGISQLQVKTILSPSKDKLETLVEALCHLGKNPGIVFCNFKDTIQRVSDYLTEKKISHVCFHGGMEQIDRERALIKFRNGTHQLIIATDLAARGLDIPEIKFIIHYQLPLKSKEFTHRNGRTARMNSDGTAYILRWEAEELPRFINPNRYPVEELATAPVPAASNWKTLYISVGRRDKISKGDIAGLFMKQGQLAKDELGIIEIAQDCAFVAVHGSKVNQLIQLLNNGRLKKKKIQLSEI